MLNVAVLNVASANVQELVVLALSARLLNAGGGASVKNADLKKSKLENSVTDYVGVINVGQMIAS